MTMTAEIRTRFRCDYDTVVWQVQRPATLEFIARPLVVFTPVEPTSFPALWKEGRYLVDMKVFGALPFGRQYIGIEKVNENDPREYVIRDNGSGQLIRKWDHHILIRRTDDDTVTDYTDRIDIDAGPLTLFIWMFAHVFYRWRQHRWKRLIARSFRQLEGKA